MSAPTAAARDRLAARVKELEEELAEWKLEAKRRGMPIENAKRLYAAEARVKELEAALRDIIDEFVLPTGGVDEDEPVVQIVRVALSAAGGELCP